jgi:DNA (cytosine-5)-methyltransferase 1
VGYHRAGFDVVGVDIAPQKNYPFEFHQADAMTYPLDGFDVVHASPPCQAYSITRHTHSVQHPDLLDPIRERLKAWGGPYVIENVPGADMPGAIELCGAQNTAHDPDTGLTLRLRRHRLFESNVFLMGEPCSCDRVPVGGVYGGGSSDRNHALEVRRGGYTPASKVRAQLMGIDWMTQAELAQAIPPAYTEFIGGQIAGVSGFVSDHPRGMASDCGGAVTVSGCCKTPAT